MAISLDDVSAIIGALVAGAGGSAGLMKLANLRSDRRLTRAQTIDAEASASQRITEAAATLVEQTGSLLPALTREVAELRGRLDTVQAERDQERAERAAERDDIARLWAWLEEHQRWDADAMDEIRKHGGRITPPEPPPARHPAAAVATP